MKKVNLVSVLALLFVLVSLISCSKEENLELLRDEQSQILTHRYVGVEVVDDRNYGSYLSFDSVKRLDSISNVLEKYSESQLEDWARGLDFESLWKQQILSLIHI